MKVELPGDEISRDEETHRIVSERALACAVIANAVLDLSYADTRDEARDFLLNRLWKRDCLWRELLGTVLDRKAIEAKVHEVCSRPVIKLKTPRNGTVDRPEQHEKCFKWVPPFRVCIECHVPKERHEFFIYRRKHSGGSIITPRCKVCIRARSPRKYLEPENEC